MRSDHYESTKDLPTTSQHTMKDYCGAIRSMMQRQSSILNQNEQPSSMKLQKVTENSQSWFRLYTLLYTLDTYIASNKQNNHCFE